MTHSRPAIAHLLDKGGLQPRRDLGQNFVTDPNTVRKIAALADVGAGDNVVEIGAGLGSLTLALAETGADIIAVEVDTGVAVQLREVVDGVDNVTVVEADATSLDWSTLLEAASSWTLVANLPYNVATPLVCDLLDDVPAIERMLVMVQREVAERFVAMPGGKAYGAVSVKIGYWADAKMVGSVPASVFIPRPNVESALVQIARRPPPVLDDVDLTPHTPTPPELFELVKRGFGQRRKMLRKSLADVVDPAAFDRADIEATRRPETLSVDEWLRLAAANKQVSAMERRR